jgi:hypothetical protein
MSKPRKKRVIDWEDEGLISPSIRLNHIGHFAARGKRRVYGRGDRFGKLTLNMDVWRAKDGRLFARFWSRNDEVDWYSYEIVGLSFLNRRKKTAVTEFGEHWVPECLRQEYDDWVLSEMPFVY